MKATNEQLIKEIDEISELNREARRRSNDVLSRVRGKLEHSDKKMSDEYERGLEDAWEMARKIILPTADGALTCDELNDIFGMRYYGGIFKEYIAHDAMNAYKDWLKEKEEEAKKPIVGDIVEVTSPLSGTAYKGIFLGKMQPDVTYILEKDCNCPTAFRGDSWVFEKTGEHVDIFGALKGE